MLAKGLAELPGVTAERGPSDTNAVYFQVCVRVFVFRLVLKIMHMMRFFCFCFVN